MRIEDLFSSVMANLKAGMKECTGTMKGFSFHVHVVGSGRDEPGFFTIQLSTSDRPAYGSCISRDEVLSTVRCKIQPELYQGRVMLEVRTVRRGSHPGEVRPKPDCHDWHNQEWRHAPFLMSADARALWCILEQNADLTGIVKEVMES